MDLKFSPEDEHFRAEVRDFLDRKLTPDMREAARKTTTVFADKDLAMRWQLILAENGWAVPVWPREYGGTDWTPTQKYIFGEECAKAHAPGLIPLGLRMLAPRELFRAQGFPESYIIGDDETQGLKLTKTAQVRMCGNSVSPPVAEAMVRANFTHEAAWRTNDERITA